ncbi:uncharacterized protein LOC110228051 isoform X2 [Arabidopsis lyrata subsp. lyrata]|uniref:uncharacterized protein LOC110228051 isoform X2 n=1 Tax=Arabidopsis lyrata subsp. lyrata TaxID=81972 RepID=UPI000A29A9A3|nr:uncharacterized protein LOC110228051 isoform X2 [Arabidopsis lyrata subsp. lyrata]|eukprot:XP_020879793.1 uncharacterized protein LOC110228051 isoform X2 [Arabidopsis lyrata subsp. lyrata]
MALDCSGWSDDDRIRLAYLMILAGILLARHKGTPLPRKTIELVRNIHRFEKYPWGRTAFKILIDSVHEVKDDLCQPSYAMDGFVQVLQIWGYEAVPMIAKKVKAHAENAIDGSSILKWKGSRARIDYFSLEQNTDKVKVNAFLVDENPLSILAPQWKDEIQDPLVSNLIGGLFCTTNFEKSIWVGHGLKEGPPRKEILIPEKRRKRRKMCRVLNEEENEELVTRSYLDSCINGLHKAISDGFDGLKIKVKSVDTKISELQKQVKTMQQSELPSGKNQSLSTASSPVIVRKCTKTIKYDLRDEFEENIPQISVKVNNLYHLDNMGSGGNKNGEEKKDDDVQITLAIPSLEKKVDFVQTVLATSPLEEKADVVHTFSRSPPLENKGDSVQSMSISSLEKKTAFVQTSLGSPPLENKGDFVQTLSENLPLENKGDLVPSVSVPSLEKNDGFVQTILATTSLLEKNADLVHALSGTSPLEKNNDSLQSVSSAPPMENNDDFVQLVSPTPSLEKNFKTRKMRLVEAKFEEFNAMLRAQLEKDRMELGLGPSQKLLSVPRDKKKSIKSLSFYDPFGPIDMSKVDALNEWNKLESNELDLGFYKVKKQFWETLIMDKKWLHTGVSNSYMNFIKHFA